MDELKKLIREVPDFPKPGINFYDITTLLKHPDDLRKTVDGLAAECEGEKVDTVIGVERAVLSARRRLPITWVRALCRCANRKSFRQSVLRSLTTSSMARVHLKFTGTR